MPEHKLASGKVIHTFAAHHAGFDAIGAAERVRIHHGIPPRPREEVLAKRWDTALRARPRLITPKFRPLDNVAHKAPRNQVVSPPTGVAPPLGPAAPPVVTNYMGGAIVQSPEPNMRWVSSTFTVPNVYPFGGVEDIWVGCSIWLGIGGQTSEDSLLVGIDVDVAQTAQQRWQGVWWRWTPDDTQWISNFPVVPGDTLSAVLCMDFESVVRARVYLHNVTSNQVTTFLVTAPPGTELTGDTAYWMISNQVIDFEGPYLARFGEMFFDQCSAGTQSGVVLFPSQRYILTDFEGTTNVAVPAILSDTLIEMQYTGP